MFVLVADILGLLSILWTAADDEEADVVLSLGYAEAIEERHQVEEEEVLEGTVDEDGAAAEEE